MTEEKKCKQCNEIILANKRIDAKFCSNTCRVASHRKKQKRAQKLKEGVTEPKWYTDYLEFLTEEVIHDEY